MKRMNEKTTKNEEVIQKNEELIQNKKTISSCEFTPIRGTRRDLSEHVSA
jgi:hypothetical protein